MVSGQSAADMRRQLCSHEPGKYRSPSELCERTLDDTNGYNARGIVSCAVCLGFDDHASAHLEVKRMAEPWAIVPIDARCTRHKGHAVGVLAIYEKVYIVL